MMQNEISPQYSNALKLEAELFLTSLARIGDKLSEVDSLLCDKLLEVTLCIEKLIKKPVKQSDNMEENLDYLTKVIRLHHCKTCKMKFRDSEIALGHTAFCLGKKQNKREIKKRAEEKRMETLPKKLNALLKADYKTFFAERLQISEKLRALHDYKVIENDITSIAQGLFPNKTIKFFKFGSRIAGIGTRNSDLDIFLDIGGCFHSFNNSVTNETKQCISLLRDELGKQTGVWFRPIAVPKARVPIIKIRHKATNIDCDIGLTNSLGYCNTQLIAYIFEIQPVARYLSIFLKRWLEVSTINNMSTYALELMVIFFLQRHNYLPAIAELQPDSNAIYIGPWLGSFVQRPLSDFNMDEISCNDLNDWLKLQVDFFTYYGQFDYKTYFICPYLGRPIRVNEFMKEMPERYKNWLKTKSTEKCVLEITSIVVQDPLELTHNVTKSVRQENLLIAYFKKCSEMLKKN